MRDVLVGTAFFVVLIVGIVGLMGVLESVNCSALATTTGHATQFSLFGGGREMCLIQVDGQWIPTSNWLVNSGN